MNPEILKQIERLSNNFQGSPWYGESLISQLKKIKVQHVNTTLPNSKNSIAILIQH